MNKTVLAIGIIFLLIGANVVSSTNNIVEDVPADYSHLESVFSSEEKTFPNTTWYMFHAYSGGGEFYVIYPNGTSRWVKFEGGDFLSGGTWTNDGRYLCCMFGNGTLYDIDPVTLYACAIGDGGVGLNGLAYNPVNEKLYGASSYDLYEINIGNYSEVFSYSAVEPILN